MRMSFRIVFIGAIVIFFAVVTVVVFIPKFVWNPADTIVGEPRVAEEEQGRVLFLSNGCNYCHTQYVRNVDDGMGAISDGGDYANDNPMILGSERTGPDLSYIGRKRSMQWEIDHLKHPRDFSPMSIMPNWYWLPEKDLRLVATYLYSLGNRVTAQQMVLPPLQYAGTLSPTRTSSALATGENPEPQGWPSFISSGYYLGKEIYVTRCMTCHGCAGNGLGTYGGTLIVTPADFKGEPFRSMPDEQWFWHVSEGIQGSVMPPWKESLTVEQRWKVIRYVQQVYAHPFERDPDEGDPPKEYQKTNPLPATFEVQDAGKHIWTRECLVCHGDAAADNGWYRAGIEPVPPDFRDKAHYGPFTDADYYWRISEGIPWTAMPTWKLVYMDAERWELVHYIRQIFTQTEKKGPKLDEEHNFFFPSVYRTQTMPKNTSYEAGKALFAGKCIDCHGVAGDGKGTFGQYLNPKPKDLRTLADRVKKGTVGKDTPAEFLSRITFGIKNTAMPAWGEILPESERWADVKYVLDTFMFGKRVTTSRLGNGNVDSEYVRTDEGIFTDEIATISPDAGRALYVQYCATCHGATGHGNGPGTVGSASGSPAPFPKALPKQYIFWRVREGVPQSMMIPFRDLLTEQELWNVTAYTVNLTGGKFGG